MSAAQVESQPNGTGLNADPHAEDGQVIFLPTSVQRVANIPVVAQTLEVVQSTIQSYPYLSAAYEKAGGAAVYLYEQSKPLHEKLSGPIHQVDAVANKGLDFVQSKAPFVFEVRTEELISKARQPADQAFAYGKTYKEAASACIAPMVDQFHAQLTRSQQSLGSLQEKLQSVIQVVTKDPKAVPDQLKHLSEQLVGELGRLNQFLAEKGQDLPQQAQQALGPLAEKFQKAYGDIKEEIGNTDVPLIQRATNVLQYSKDQASPIVAEVVQAVKKVIKNEPSSES